MVSKVYSVINSIRNLPGLIHLFAVLGGFFMANLAFEVACAFFTVRADLLLAFPEKGLHLN